jgi:hypothetical protein
MVMHLRVTNLRVTNIAKPGPARIRPRTSGLPANCGFVALRLPYVGPMT